MTENTTLGRGGRRNYFLNNYEGQSHGGIGSSRSNLSTNHHRRTGIFTRAPVNIAVEPRNYCQHDPRPERLLREVSREEISIENNGEGYDYLSCSDSDGEAISSRGTTCENDSEREPTPFYFSVNDGDTDESNADFSMNDSDTDSHRDLSVFSNFVLNESTPQTVNGQEPINAASDPEIEHDRNTESLDIRARNEVHDSQDFPHGHFDSVRYEPESEDVYSYYSNDSSSIVESIYESDASEEYNASAYDSVEEDGEGEDENEDILSPGEVTSLSEVESGYPDVMSTDEVNREVEASEDNRSFSLDTYYHSSLDSERGESGIMTIEDEEVAKLTERLELEEKREEENNPKSGACGTSFRETVLEQTVEALERENEKYRLSLMCKVCLNQEVQIVFVPCGHLATCSQCSLNLLTCPLCRRGILNRIRVYKS